MANDQRKHTLFYCRLVAVVVVVVNRNVRAVDGGALALTQWLDKWNIPSWMRIDDDWVFRKEVRKNWDYQICDDRIGFKAQ